MSLSVYLATLDWRQFYDTSGIDNKLQVFEEQVKTAIDIHCPEVTTRVRLNSRFYVSAKLAELSEQKNLEYRTNKNSDRFKLLRKQVKKEIRDSNRNRINNAVSRANGSYSWIKEVARLGDHLGEHDRSEISLPEHVDAGLSAQERCEDVANFFSQIRREYEPLSRHNMPDRVVSALDNCPCSNHPRLDDYQVYEVMKQRKVTASVKGDIHPTIIKECMTELAHPVGVLFRDAVETHTWPHN